MSTNPKNSPTGDKKRPGISALSLFGGKNTPTTNFGTGIQSPSRPPTDPSVSFEPPTGSTVDTLKQMGSNQHDLLHTLLAPSRLDTGGSLIDPLAKTGIDAIKDNGGQGQTHSWQQPGATPNYQGPRAAQQENMTAHQALSQGSGQQSTPKGTASVHYAQPGEIPHESIINGQPSHEFFPQHFMGGGQNEAQHIANLGPAQQALLMADKGYHMPMGPQQSPITSIQQQAVSHPTNMADQYPEMHHGAILPNDWIKPNTGEAIQPLQAPSPPSQPTQTSTPTGGSAMQMLNQGGQQMLQDMPPTSNEVHPPSGLVPNLGYNIADKGAGIMDALSAILYGQNPHMRQRFQSNFLGPTTTP